MSSVNTNMGAVVSAANMAKFGRELDTSIERLSSGLRINSAKDDAAGMAIVSKMEAQVRGVTQAIRNATDSQKLIDTSEGAHVETLNILQRMRELAVQASNDTNQALDRSFLNAEATQLIAEIDRIANQTTWNSEKILDGNFSSKQFQLGANKNEKVTYSIDSAKSAAIGNYEVNGTADVESTSSSGILAHTLTVSGYIGSSTVSVSAGASAADVVSSINTKTASTGVKAEAVTKAKIDSVDATGTVAFTLSNGTSTVNISADITDTSDLRALKDAVNAKAGTTGITAEMLSTSNASLILTHSTGEDIIIDAYTHSGSSKTMDLHVLDADGNEISGAGFVLDLNGTTAGTADMAVVTGQIDFDSHKTFTVVSDVNTAGDNFLSTTASNTSELSAISAISLGTASGAESAISVIDAAINKINQSRADLGAISNRLDSTISNLTNVATNVEGSMSNIRDADFSQETSKLTRAQILTQAATSMLAQANTSKQSILALLQG
ncbi:flagellin [Alphaproteobacteria bacterium]|nr:flagellin [Alphaproteobacteria bacterium]